MAPKSKINYIKCVKLLKTTKDNLVCSKCENSLHLKCSRPSPKEFSKYKKGKTKFICQFCTDYTCIKCDRHIEYGQKGVLCTGCNLWIHQKSAGITKAEYQNIGNNKEKPCYCRPCKANMFPFYGLSNYQFYNFVSSEIFTTKAKTPENKTKTMPSSNTNGSICVKKNALKKGLKCPGCKMIIHKNVQDLNSLNFV